MNIGNDIDVDVPEELLQQILTGNYDFNMKTDDAPYLEILLQPKQRGYRFRYSSEGITHGGIPAESTEKGNKKFPTVHIANYSGKAGICISLVTADDPPQAHAHNLVGKEVTKGILYCEDDKKEWVKTFTNLGIQHVTKKDLVKVLHEKLCQSYQFTQFSSAIKTEDETQSFDISALIGSFGGTDGAGTMIDESVAIAVAEEENKRLRKEAEEMAKTIDLSAVRLCIVAYLPDEAGLLTRALPAVFSKPIFDQKAAHSGQLKICRISKPSSSVNGGEEVFLLCDKVQKDDISVRFYQEDGAGNATWEGFGKFTQADVHKQSAIVFTTPPYVDKAIQRPVEVWLQLKRGKDKECSEPVKFTYRPEEYDRYKIGEKRRKGLPENLEEMLNTAKQSRPATSTISSAPADLSQFNMPEGVPLDISGIRFFKQSNQGPFSSRK